MNEELRDKIEALVTTEPAVYIAKMAHTGNYVEFLEHAVLILAADKKALQDELVLLHTRLQPPATRFEVMP